MINNFTVHNLTKSHAPFIEEKLLKPFTYFYRL